MIFSKIFLFFFLIFFSAFFYILSFYNFISWSSFFSFSYEEKILPSFLGLTFDFVSVTFIMMVSLVTCLVFLYSEVYMELYNNKKFFYLTLSFFLSMIILSSGSSVMNSMIGWDGLGISSLFLIMFYPNKISFFNSFMTFFFNRMGDILFLIFFCYSFSEYSVFFFFSKSWNFLLIFIFFLCMMTKSAQIPFSSWLPAAMSAPTPISAMVHSSTLVTAGIFLILKFFALFQNFNIFSILLIISIMTFLMGGIFGVLELDLKKIVAFSTMSQISMILFFLCSKPFLALFHTFGHALFKTLLFCSCGLSFLLTYSDQSLKNLSKSSSLFCAILFFFVSIYSMSGMIFSSSFFTKDMIMEFFLEEKHFFFFFFLIIGSFFTIMYSCKIFSSISFSPSLKFSFLYKLNHFLFILFFVLMSIFLLKFLIYSTLGNNICLISNSEIFIINLIIISFFFFNLFKLPNLMFYSMEILFLKNFSFSSMSKMLNIFPSYFIHSDTFFFKPSSIFFSNFFNSPTPFKFWPYLILLIIFYCIN